MPVCECAWVCGHCAGVEVADAGRSLHVQREIAKVRGIWHKVLNSDSESG